MVILINFEDRPFNVKYKSGNKSLVKQFPVNTIVAMKGLNNSAQITNEKFLLKQDVTIWDYERNTFMKRSASTPTGTTLPLMFIGNDVKPSQFTRVSFGFSGSTTISGMTFSKQNVAASTLYEIITSAHTGMANNTISAQTTGNNTVVYFSGANTTTQNVYGALTGSSFSGLGITVTGQGATKISTGSTITFYLSATTTEIASGYEFLRRMV